MARIRLAAGKSGVEIRKCRGTGMCPLWARLMGVVVVVKGKKRLVDDDRCWEIASASNGRRHKQDVFRGCRTVTVYSYISRYPGTASLVQAKWLLVRRVEVSDQSSSLLYSSTPSCDDGDKIV